MTQLKTPMLAIDKIEIEDDFNPRREIDQGALEGLAASIARHELVQPIAVRPIDGGRYAVIAGHRRYEAAKIAGLEKVPVTIRDGESRFADTLVENLHRENLNPIDVDHGLAQFAQSRSLGTNKAIAEELDLSPTWVARHRRLLKLPKELHVYFAEGTVGIEAERQLRELAKVSPRAAACVCELAERNGVPTSRFHDDFPQLLEAVPRSKFSDPPTMIPIAAPLSEIVADADKARELGDRYLAARPHFHTADPRIGFAQEEIDSARAAGCLIETEVDHGGWSSHIAFITDGELAADLATRYIEQVEREAAERRKLEENSCDGSWPGSSGSDPADGDAEKAPSAYEQRKARQAEGRTWNQGLSRRILKHRNSSTTKAQHLARAKALAVAFLEDNPDLAAEGLRLVLSQLQTVEHRQLKTTGETREQITYASAEDARRWLADRIEASRSVNEVLDVWTDAVLAQMFADEGELAKTQQVGGGGTLSHGRPAELLAADVKAVRPRRKRGRGR